MELKKRVVSYQGLPLAFDMGDLMPMTEAASVLGLSIAGVISMIERDQLTEFAMCEGDRPLRGPGNRFVSRAEVLQAAQGVKARAELRRDREGARAEARRRGV